MHAFCVQSSRDVSRDIFIVLLFTESMRQQIKGEIAMKTKQAVGLVQMALMAAISVVLVYFVRIPLIPAATFLVYDMADVPILLGTLMLGIVPGLLILLVVSLIQAFLLSTDGWVGLLMHLVATGTLVVVVGLFHYQRHTWTKTIIGMVCGTLAMTAVMTAMNILITPWYQGYPLKVVIDLLIPVFIPFNLLKGGINSLLTVLLLRALTPIMKKNPHLFPVRF